MWACTISSTSYWRINKSIEAFQEAPPQAFFSAYETCISVSSSKPTSMRLTSQHVCSCRSRPKRHKIVKTDESGNRRRRAGPGNAFCGAWTDWMPCAWYIVEWQRMAFPRSRGKSLASLWFHCHILKWRVFVSSGKVCGWLVAWPPIYAALKPWWNLHQFSCQVLLHLS